MLWQSIWGIVTRPLVLLSGVVIMIETLPQAWQGALMWNPLVHVVGEVRAGFYYGYHPDYVDPAYVFGVSLVTLVLGLLFTWRFHREALET